MTVDAHPIADLPNPADYGFTVVDRHELPEELRTLVAQVRELVDAVAHTEADPDERARAGLFMAFQYPVAIPGVTVAKYLRMVMNAHREGRGEQAISLKDFRKTVEEAMKLTAVPKEFSSRYLNDGFSGGEKKRMELLQLALLRPEIAVLDETDSGLDIDALRIVSGGVNALRAQGRSFLVITHYQRLLDYIVPDVVHVMSQGQIMKSGDKDLAKALELVSQGQDIDYEGATAVELIGAGESAGNYREVEFKDGQIQTVKYR